MKLEITGGPDAGKTFEPEGDRFTVGREDVDLLLGDDEVSRRHAEFRPLPDGQLEVTDLGSRNGTRVDGERLTGPRTLSGGEEITIGVTTIRVHAPPPPAAGETVVAGDAPPIPAPPPADDDATAVSETPPGLTPTEPVQPPPPPEPPTPAPEPPAPPPEPTTPPPAPPPAAAPPPPAPPPPSPPPPAAPPSPPAFGSPGAPPAAAPERASTGKRVTALVLSILVALVAVILVIASIIVLGLTPCDDAGFLQEAIADPSAECYDGTEGQRAIATALIGLGGIASIAFLVFSIGYFSKSRRGNAVVASGVAAVVLLTIGAVL